MNEKLVLVLVLLLAAQAVQAKELVPTIMFSVESEEGNTSIESARVLVDYLSDAEPMGEHALKLKNSEGQTLYQLRVYLVGFSFPPYGLETTDYNMDEYYENAEKNFTKTYWVPYMENAEYAVIEGEEGEIARFDLGVLCNANGACDESETFLSCEQDCPLDKKDNYCLPLTDEICDPDCAKGIDPDCETAQATPTPAFTITPEPTPEEGTGIDLIGIGLLLAVAIVALAVFFKWKKAG